MKTVSITFAALAAAALTQPVCAMPTPAISAAWENYREEDDEDLVLLADTYECAVAISAMAKQSGEAFRTDPDDIMSIFGDLLVKTDYGEDDVHAAMQARMRYWKAALPPADYRIWATDLAHECDQVYAELQSRPSAPDGERRAITAQYLQEHLGQTGDYRNVADFIVHSYPSGSNPFAENAMGELLGQMVVEAGPDGLLMFSDAAVLAMIENHYWKYNPAASRLVDNEYRRRLRMQRMTSEQGSEWSRRAARDRAEQARRAEAPWVRSIGKHCEKYMVPPGSGSPAMWVTECR